MTNQNDYAYVREAMLPEQTPPASQVGIIKWMRENLFSGVFNTLLTIASIFAIYWVLAHILPWIFNSVWNAGSLSECREVLETRNLDGHAGACSAVIQDRWQQLLFGFYPRDLYWRPIVTLLLMFVALAPVLFPQRVSSKLYYFTFAYPFIAVWLLWGGSFWSPILLILGFVLAWAAYKLLHNLVGNLFAIIGAIVVALVWWFFLMGVVNDGLHRMVGNARLESTQAELQQKMEVLPDQIEDAEARQEVANAEVAELVAQKNAVLEDAKSFEEEGQSVPQDVADDMTAVMKELTEKREAANKITQEVIALTDEQSEARGLIGQIEGLPANQAKLDDPEVQNSPEYGQVKANVQKVYDTVGLVGLKRVPSNKFGGFMLSIIIGVSGIAFSLPLGILLALGRQSNLFFINKMSVIFIETIRGVPLIVWLFTAQLLLNYFLPPGTNFDILVRVIIMVTLFSSAYIAEVIRGGLAALPKGQYEAADALGLDYWKSMRLVVLPQALKISIPGIVNTFIGLFKDTTLVVFIGLFDPLGLASAARASTEWNGIYWELFVFIGLMFFIFCFSMGRYSLYLEKRLQRGHH